MANNLIETLTITIIMGLMAQAMLAWAKKPDQPGPTWAKTIAGHGKERTTELEFYFHHSTTSDPPTVVQVVPAPDGQPLGFGYIEMADDPLTVGPDVNSKLVGRAQGMLASASQGQTSLLMSMTFTFSDGVYNGSSFSVLGLNPIREPTRELPVVGGTGMFRMARGYANLRTHSIVVNISAIVAYRVTLVH